MPARSPDSTILDYNLLAIGLVYRKLINSEQDQTDDNICSVWDDNGSFIKNSKNRVPKTFSNAHSDWGQHFEQYAQH